MRQWEHSAILLTFIKLPIVIKIFVLSIFEWPFYTGLTVVYKILSCLPYAVLLIIFLFSANIDPGRRYLYLHIKSGKAFLEHIDENDGTPGQVASYFSFHIHFRGQRFKSRPIACACEPDIDEGFLLELHKDGAGMYSKTLKTKLWQGIS